MGRKSASIMIAWGLAALTGGCDRSVVISPLDPGEGLSGAPTWHGPIALDLGEIRDPTQASFYSVNEQDPTNAFNAIANPAFALTETSFADYRLTASRALGGLVASFYDGTRFRAFGRMYAPFTWGGNGWAKFGPQAAFIDTGSGDFTNLAAGFSSTHTLFSVLFPAGGAAASVAQAAFGVNGTWSDFNPFGGLGFETAPADGHPFNGHSSSIAWDVNGHAFYGFADASGEGYIRSYASGAWEPTAGARVGSGARSFQLLDDGIGMTALWLGNDTVLATDVFAGEGTACAITRDGARCWGENSKGQTGSGSTTTPQPLGLAVDAVAAAEFDSMSVGPQHTCALTTSRLLLCWGRNLEGQIGAGNTLDPQADPVTVTLPNSELPLSVAAGNTHTCAATTAGNVYCWGNDADGELGDGVAGPSTTAPGVAAGGAMGTVVEVAAGYLHTCARNSAGGIFCWGSNDFGQIGNGGALVDTPTPAAVVGLPGGGVLPRQVAAKGNLSCALFDNDTVYCWGLNDVGQTGQAPAATQVTPAQVALPALLPREPANLALPEILAAETLTSISLGATHACALTSRGRVLCWGSNDFGQFGDGTTAGTPRAPAALTLPPGTAASRVAAGNGFTCILTDTGVVACWGINADGQIATGSASAPVTTASDALASGNQAVRAAWSADNNLKTVSNLGVGDVKSMAAASDDRGNVMAVFIQAVPDYPAPPPGTIVTTLPVRNNDVRIFASVRGADGVWVGPSQLDDPLRFDPFTTTLFQQSLGDATAAVPAATIAGGIDYFTPAVAYVGNGRFLVAFALTNVAGYKSSIYVRGYSVGGGWDPASSTFNLDSLSIPDTALEAFRYANELSFAGDGRGNAILAAQVVVPSGLGESAAFRNYGIHLYSYSSKDGWRAPVLAPNSICRAQTATPTAVPTDAYFCWNIRPQTVIFPGGETVVVYPAPAAAAGAFSARLRLFGMELHL